MHARFLIRGINENGCNLFGQAGIVLSTLLCIPAWQKLSALTGS